MRSRCSVRAGMPQLLGALERAFEQRRAAADVRPGRVLHSSSTASSLAGRRAGDGRAAARRRRCPRAARRSARADRRRASGSDSSTTARKPRWRSGSARRRRSRIRARHQLVERAVTRARVAVLRSVAICARAAARRRRRAYSTSHSSRASGDSAPRRAASDVGKRAGRSPSSSVRGQRPAAGLVAREAAVDQVLRELHRRARVACASAWIRLAHERQVRHVAEHRAHQRLGLLRLPTARASTVRAQPSAAAVASRRRA